MTVGGWVDLTPHTASFQRRLESIHHPQFIALQASIAFLMVAGMVRFFMVLFCASLWLFLLGVEPFQYGLWFQTEPIMMGLFLLAGAVAAGMAWHKNTQLSWKHPVLMVAALWLGWQVLATLSATTPWRSWFGAPETGEGTGWHMAWVVLLAGFWQCWHAWPERRGQLWWAMTSSTAAMVLLHLINPDGIARWRPAHWGDYLGYAGGWLWMVTAAANRDESKPYRWWLGGAVAVAAVMVSDSLAALGLVLPAMALSLLLMRWQALPQWLVPSRRVRILASLAVILPLLWIPISQLGGLFPDKDTSLGMRSGFNQVAMLALSHEPARLAVGDGWGGFTDDLLRYGSLVDGVRLYEKGTFAPNWTMLEGHAFHSHNGATEVLVSLGVPGLLLWLLLPILIIWQVEARLFWLVIPVHLALTAMAHLWFMLPQMVPFHALAWAAVSGARPMPATPRCQRWVMIVFCAALLTSATLHGQVMRYGQQLIAHVTTTPAEQVPMAWITSDMPRGGDHFWWVAVNYSHYFQRRILDHPVPEAFETAWMKRLIDAASIGMADPRFGDRAALIALRLSNQMLTSNIHLVHFQELRDALTPRWMGLNLDIIRRLPMREEYQVPMLSQLLWLAQGDAMLQYRWLEHMLLLAPNHRGALWGMARLQTGYDMLKTTTSAAEAQERAARAIALGADRVLPLTEAEIAPFTHP